jgi:hypothetical protein
LKSKELHILKRLSVSAGNAEIYATLVDAKLEQEAIYIIGVQNKSIKKHFWRDYHRKIIICIYNFNGKRYFSWSSLGIFLSFMIGPVFLFYLKVY